MPEPSARTAFVHQLRAAAAHDPRIAGLIDYGSGAEGRADEWSDVDVTVLVRDADFDAFSRDWVAWAGQFGALLLAYTGHIGHPWTVYDTEPVPLRADFYFLPASQVDAVLDEPTSPLSVETMLWYDDTGGALRDRVARLVGRSRRPRDARADFDRLCGDLWYHLLFAWSKLRRGEHWVARQAFHTEVMQPLLYLLRLEAGALARWQSSPSALDAESVLPSTRLAALDRCIPAPGPSALHRALHAAATLGRDACAAIAHRELWPWPDVLAERVIRLTRT